VILPDVNVLVYAFKTGVPEHERYRDWLASALEGPEAVGLSDLVLAGVVRVVTHPRVFDAPSSAADALDYARSLRESPTAVVLAPGPRHWSIFAELVATSGARGNLVADAYHAALAIEHGCEWITTDRGFARFPWLRWRHPLAATS
jgi:toxin-antitoxin system PIN domain toxin